MSWPFESGAGRLWGWTEVTTCKDRTGS